MMKVVCPMCKGQGDNVIELVCSACDGFGVCLARLVSREEAADTDPPPPPGDAGAV